MCQHSFFCQNAVTSFINFVLLHCLPHSRRRRNCAHLRTTLPIADAKPLRPMDSGLIPNSTNSKPVTTAGWFAITTPTIPSYSVPIWMDCIINHQGEHNAFFHVPVIENEISLDTRQSTMDSFKAKWLEHVMFWNRIDDIGFLLASDKMSNHYLVSLRVHFTCHCCIIV